MRYGLASVEVVYNDLILKSPNIISSIPKSKKISLKSKLTLKDITYHYPNTDKKILNKINLDIEANTTIGIIGKSGSGKTTLIDLIIGILDPSGGEILIDEKKKMSKVKRLWQNNIGYIPQFIYLLDDTISKNIALGDEKIKHKQ